MYASTHYSSSETKDEFSRDLFGLLRGVRPSDVVVRDFNAQLCYLEQTGRTSEARLLSTPCGRTDNGNRLIRVCSDRGPFLENRFLPQKTTSASLVLPFTFTALNSH